MLAQQPNEPKRDGTAARTVGAASGKARTPVPSVPRVAVHLYDALPPKPHPNPSSSEHTDDDVPHEVRRLRRRLHDKYQSVRPLPDGLL